MILHNFCNVQATCLYRHQFTIYNQIHEPDNF